jgi:hypothetical protein
MFTQRRIMNIIASTKFLLMKLILRPAQQFEFDMPVVNTGKPRYSRKIRPAILTREY